MGSLEMQSFAFDPWSNPVSDSADIQEKPQRSVTV